jgi:hypothetical protein
VSPIIREAWFVKVPYTVCSSVETVLIESAMSVRSVFPMLVML